MISVPMCFSMSELASPNSNIRDLHPKILRLMSEDLDLGSKWRDLIACADGTKYELRLDDGSTS